MLEPSRLERFGLGFPVWTAGSLGFACKIPVLIVGID